MHRFSIICLSLIFTLATCICQGQSSVLSTGSWYKVAIEKNGVYKITYDQLKKMGFDVATLDPRTIKVYGQEGGMLPQPNSTARPADLVELAIAVNGEDDATLNKEDYVLFYAQGPDKTAYLTSKQIFAYESNLYSEKNFYFITAGNNNGKRLTHSENLTTEAPAVQHYNDFIYHEVDEYNDRKSGREWFGEAFEFTPEISFNIDIAGIAQNSAITFVSDVMAQSFNGSSFKLFFNGNLIGQQNVAAILNTQYGVKGRHKRDTITFTSTAVAASEITKQEIKYQYVRATSGRSSGFLDFFLISVKRKLARYGNQTIFRSAESLQNTHARYEISNAVENCQIWDISDPYEPEQQTFAFQSGSATFTTASEQLKEFIIFNNDIPTPELIETIANQNLHGLTTPDMLIITHPDFVEEANRLASHRASHNNWSTVVATTDQVFNEFSSGRQDVTAIRDFTKHLYDKNPSVLKSLLLIGKGSYDYKDRIQNNTNFVPTYESRNSLTPLETYSSDDYYGFLEEDEGNWGEGSPAQNHTLDIGVGRLPVKTIDEAKAVVDKIINYDVNKKALGRWRKDIVFVADDGSTADGFTSIHQSQANTMANAIENSHPEFNTRKLFLGTYGKTVAPSGETIPEANEDIIENFNRGTLIINYTGHGSEKLWADEKIFTDSDIETLENKLYPFLVTATCEFGRQDDPADISSAELSVIKKNGGAIGLVTTARPVNSNTNFSLNQEFYEALFQKESTRYLTLGEIFRRTKNNSTSGVANRNFSLLSDPSLTLALPSLSITVTQIKTASGSDTLKALSTVIIKGQVQDADGNLVSDFNGTLESTLFDKQTDFVTIGKNDPAFSFKQWYNALFRGKATIKNGEFQFQCIIPKNISYEVDYGKLSLYAADPTTLRDASGATNDFKIGESEENPIADTASPELKLFMGDTTFVNGGITGPNTTLIARIYDASGVNISNYGIGNTMIAVLDNDQQAYVLNEYYIADPDDITRGWINFPIKNLPPGKHTIRVKVWDTYNNPAEATINFIVTDGEMIVLESFGNYPNPFRYETTLFFTHNRSGDDLQAQLYLYDMAGQQLKDYEFTVLSSPYQVNLLELNDLDTLGKKLPNGLYLARLVVRSLTNGSKSEQVTKLIILN